MIVVRSLWWPGAYTFFSEGRWTSIYIGDGLKYEDVSYYPVFPPEIRSDPKEKGEYPEPNPKEAPVPKQEEEKKEEEQ